MPKSDGLVDQPTHIVLAADVGTQKVGLRAELAQLGDHPFVFVVASTGHDDASAFGREGACRRAADTRERAGDQYDRGLHEMLLGMGPTDRTGSVRKPIATTVPCYPQASQAVEGLIEPKFQHSPKLRHVRRLPSSETKRPRSGAGRFPAS